MAQAFFNKHAEVLVQHLQLSPLVVARLVSRQLITTEEDEQLCEVSDMQGRVLHLLRILRKKDTDSPNRFVQAVVGLPQNVMNQLQADLGPDSPGSNSRAPTASVSAGPGVNLVSTASQRAASGSKWELYVKTLTGETVVLHADPGATTEQLKCLFYEKNGTPPDAQRLIFAGKEMEDERQVRFYGVTHESTLNLITRLYGT